MIDVTSKTKEELRELGNELEPYIGKLAPNLGLGKLQEAVALGLRKREEKIEGQVKADAEMERRQKLGAQDRQKGHPSPETVAIEASQKVYATFLNEENPGADGELGTDVKFFKGEKYMFHLWDQQRHVLPQCLVVPSPESDTKLLDRMIQFWEGVGMTGNHATKQARSHLHQMSLLNSAVAPRTERRYNKKEDQMMTVIVGNTPRFRFTEIEPAPADAEYGLVILETNDGKNTHNEPAA
jgi:hypothetical protein